MLLLKLGAPLFAIYMSSVFSWIWSSSNFSPQLGGLPLPNVIILAAVVIMGIYAISRRLPLILIVWPPAGLASLFILVSGLLSNEFDASAGILSAAIYVFIYLFVLLVAFRLMSRGVSLSICYALIFIFCQAIRFPTFEADFGLGNSNLLTFLCALRALVEITIATLIIRLFVLSEVRKSTKLVWYLFLLTLSHGITAGWEGPLLANSLSFATAISQTLRWFGFLIIQLGFIVAIYRMQRAFDFFAEVEYVPTEDQSK